MISLYFEKSRLVCLGLVPILLIICSCFSSFKKGNDSKLQDGSLPGSEIEPGPYDNHRFSILNNGEDELVIDRNTKLMWQLTYQSNMNFQQAMEYCSEMEYGGLHDWHLPDEDELLSLIDRKKRDPASTFPNTPLLWFWTSTQSLNYEDFARFIRFDIGDVKLAIKENLYAVRCVRR